jgi:putative membrane protein
VGRRSSGKSRLGKYKVYNRPISMEKEKKAKMLSLRNPAFILSIQALVVSAITYIGAYYKDVWVFELVLGWIAVTALLLTSGRFRFSNMVYYMVGIHFLVLAIGAHYSYAEMPLFNWLKDAFNLQRNYYDRVGHFMQGFVPAMVARELILRQSKLEKGRLLGCLVILTVLGLSAFYEFIEWWVVIFIYPTQGIVWLGMQGDIWDAQQDMFQAFIGATIAILFFSNMHDRSMTKVMRQELIHSKLPN